MAWVGMAIAAPTSPPTPPPPVTGGGRERGEIKSPTEVGAPRSNGTPDTLDSRFRGNDTTRIDTTRSKAQLDTVITYSADSVSFTFNPRETVLIGDAKVAYRDMELTAAKITVHWSEDLLVAEPDSAAVRRFGSAAVTDTAGTGGVLDSTLRRKDNGDLDSRLRGNDKRGLPRLVDGTQTVDGERMVYNIKTRRGRVIQGKTKYDEGYTGGQVIKKVDENIMDIGSGTYTTCDAPNPHYHFWSKDLKLVVKDKIVARPVVLFFGPVPVMIIPFAVFPARGGRHSGVIIPTYGESSGQGRFFRNLGYYWAPNDYMDFKTSMDYYEKFGLLFRGDADYVKRYQYTGSLSGSFNNQRKEGESRGYDLVFRHNHNLSPSASLNISVNYASSRQYRQDLSQNPYQRMNQTIRSDATLNKSWPGTPYSASANVNFVQDLQSRDETRSIPRVSFSRSKSPFVAQAEGARLEDAKWYNLLYWNYGLSAENRRRVVAQRLTTYESVDGVLQPITTQSVLPPVYRSGAQHTVGFNASIKPLGYVALTPAFNYNEAWFDEWLDYRREASGKVDTVKHKTFSARRTFNAGASLSTKLYGLFQPHVFGLEAIRHTVTPSLSFNYRPDFGDEKWGIYRQFADSLGRITYYDRYAGALYPSPGRGKGMTLGIGLDNLFQYKIKRGDKETKGDIFSLTMGTSHNFAADSMKWSDLTSSLQVRPLGQAGVGYASLSGLTLTVTGDHSFYAQATNPLTGRSGTINRPAPNGLRLVAFDLGSSFQLKGGTPAQRDSTRPPTQIEQQPEDRFASPVWTPSPLPWEAGVGFHYGERHDAFATSKNAWASMNLELQATRNWKVSYDTRFDMIAKRVVSSNISIYRDLHCWEGRFTWNPMGVGQGYYLIISIKSPQLHDIKVERQRGAGGFLGY